MTGHGLLDNQGEAFNMCTLIIVDFQFSVFGELDDTTRALFVSLRNFLRFLKQKSVPFLIESHFDIFLIDHCSHCCIQSDNVISSLSRDIESEAHTRIIVCHRSLQMNKNRLSDK